MSCHVTWFWKPLDFFTAFVRWCCLSFQTSSNIKKTLKDSAFILRSDHLLTIHSTPDYFLTCHVLWLAALFHHKAKESIWSNMCVPVHVSLTRGLMSHDRFHVLLSECTPYVFMSYTSRKIRPVHVRMPKTVKSSHREENIQYVITLLYSVSYQCSYARVSSNVWWPLTQPAYLIRMLWQQKNACLPLSFYLSDFLFSLFPMHHSHLDPRCACIIP